MTFDIFKQLLEIEKAENVESDAKRRGITVVLNQYIPFWVIRIEIKIKFLTHVDFMAKAGQDNKIATIASLFLPTLVALFNFSE